MATEGDSSTRRAAALAACRLDFCPVAAYPFGVGKTVIMSDRKVRLDVLLVDRGLVESREKAQALVLAGEVSVDGARVARPATGVLLSAAAERFPAEARQLNSLAKVIATELGDPGVYATFRRAVGGP